MNDEIKYNDDGDVIPPRPKDVPINYVWKCISGICAWVPPDNERTN